MDLLPLTVMMPIKNYHPVFLNKAVKSIFDQTDGEWRLLFIVESEDEASFRTLLEQPLADPRTRLLINEGRKLAGKFNTAMRASETEFVAILQSDDMWAADAVETLRIHIRRYPQIDFFYTARQIIDEEDRPQSSIYMPPTSFTVDDFAISSPVKHLLCWRREFALAIGGMDETLNNVGPDDYDFPWTMTENGAKFMAILKCLYLYRDHRESFRLTTHLPLDVHLAELRRILLKHNVPPQKIESILKIRRKGYLRQCLYRNDLDRSIKEKLRFNPRWGWREKYK